MQIAFGRNARDNVPRQRELSFEQFVEVVKRAPVHHGSLSAAEYRLAGREERARDKDSGWFIPALFVRPERKATAVSQLDAFVLDFDDGEITRRHLENLGCAFVAWTSYSHTPEKEKWRVVIPYATPITDIKNGKSAQHQAIYEHFQAIFEGHLDSRCATVSQLWYLPGHPRDAVGHEILAVVDGPCFVLQTVAVHSGNASAGIGGVPPVRALATRKSLNADLSGRSPPSLRDIEKALNEIDPSGFGPTRYTEWTTLGFAVYEGTSGSREGYDIFDTWSRRIPGYEAAGITTEKWASFGGSREGPRITVATLFKLAAEATNIPHHADVAPDHHDAPASTVQPPAEASSVRHSLSPDSQPALPVLPLIVTAPVPMPVGFRNHPTEFAIQKEVDSETGDNKTWKTVIRGFRALSLELLESVVEETNTAVLTAQSTKKTRTATFGTSLMAAPSDFKAELNSRGIYCRMEEFKELQELLVDWLKKIQDADRVKRSFTHYGWMEKDGTCLGFAAGDTAYYCNKTKETGIKIATRNGSPHAPFYLPQGRMKPWKDVAAFLVGQQNQSLLAVLATSFASPLMRFSGHSGAVVSIVSSASGVGKSSVLTTSQSVWGKPGATVHSATDTVLSLASKMGFTKNLPAYWDDIKGNDKMWGQFAEMIYQVTQGKEKSRLDQSANPRPIQEWCCLAVIAANDSIFEVMKRYSKGGTDSGVARVFEIRLEERPTDVVPSTFFDQCKDNYGHAGAVYAEWLARYRSIAERKVVEKTAQLSAELNMTSEERFWIAAMSTMIVGAAIAKALCLVDFDIPVLETFLKQRFHQLRANKVQASVEAGPEDRINGLIFDHQQTTLVVDTIARNNSGTTMIIRPPVRGEVEITYIKADQVLRIRRSKFNEWCATKNTSPETLRIELERVGALKERNVDPMVGVKPYTLDKRTACYDIDLKTLGVKGDVDGQAA